MFKKLLSNRVEKIKNTVVSSVTVAFDGLESRDESVFKFRIYNTCLNVLTVIKWLFN